MELLAMYPGGGREGDDETTWKFRYSTYIQVYVYIQRVIWTKGIRREIREYPGRRRYGKKESESFHRGKNTNSRCRKYMPVLERREVRRGKGYLVCRLLGSPDLETVL